MVLAENPVGSVAVSLKPEVGLSSGYTELL